MDIQTGRTTDTRELWSSYLDWYNSPITDKIYCLHRDFYLIKEGLNWQVFGVKLLKEVLLKVIECKKYSNTFVPHVHFKKKIGINFGMSPLALLGGRNLLSYSKYSKIKDFSSCQGILEAYSKTDPIYFLKVTMGKKVLLYFLHLITLKSTSFSNFTPKTCQFRPCFIKQKS